MSRILLIGYNPPQFVKNAKIEAAHYRTWQFLLPLLDDGHVVCLCAGADGEYISQPEIPESWMEQLVYQPVPFGKRGWVKKLQEAHDSFAPDCVVAVNFSHCLYATKLRTDRPIWMDIYGDVITIMQASCFRAGTNRGMSTSINFLHEVLRKGDVFSGCGKPQRHMLVGELGMSGRLNNLTFGYDFARVVLPGSPPGQQSRNWLSNDTLPRRQTRGTSGQFIVLWCGGYNTWTDVETLFKGLEHAMSQSAQVQFVSVGASTYGNPDNVYAQFLEMVEASPFRGCFHMMGWQPWSEVNKYFQQSDVGLNIDAMHYETIYGTRTRLVEMIAAGLPVITSLGSELSYLLTESDAALAFRAGDWRGLAEQILILAKDGRRRDEMADKAAQYAANELSFYTTLAPVRDWVRNPQLAPDKIALSVRERIQQYEYQLRATMRLVAWRLRASDK